MVTIRNIDETFRFYGSFGADRQKTGNGTRFTFPDKSSYIRFWGDLHDFCVAAVDFTPPEDVIFRSQIHQRYLGIGFHEEGRYLSYMRKSDVRESTAGINCFVLNSPAPHFLKLAKGQRLRFHGMYFQEQFFQENNVLLYGSFWEDAKCSIGSGEIHSPELIEIYQRIERCPLIGEPFQIWMRGQGLAAAGFLLELVHRYSATQPVYLSEAELAAVAIFRHAACLSERSGACRRCGIQTAHPKQSAKYAFHIGPLQTGYHEQKQASKGVSIDGGKKHWRVCAYLADGTGA